MSAKFLWEAGDLEPAWLALASDDMQRHLAQLLVANAGAEDRAREMLAEVPWPTTAEEASARVADVLAFLLEEPS